MSGQNSEIKENFPVTIFSVVDGQLLFVVFGRLSYSFFTDVKSNLGVPPVYLV